MNVKSISIMNEVSINLIFLKLVSFFENFFNFGFDFDLLFFYKNPVFFYTGFLFLFSTVLSLALMSYLGLYGVFITNLITLFTL
jgi:hypothetical protein